MTMPGALNHFGQPCPRPGQTKKQAAAHIARAKAKRKRKLRQRWRFSK